MSYQKANNNKLHNKNKLNRQTSKPHLLRSTSWSDNQNNTLQTLEQNRSNSSFDTRSKHFPFIKTTSFISTGDKKYLKNRDNLETSDSFNLCGASGKHIKCGPHIIRKSSYKSVQNFIKCGISGNKKGNSITDLSKLYRIKSNETKSTSSKGLGCVTNSGVTLNHTNSLNEEVNSLKLLNFNSLTEQERKYLENSSIEHSAIDPCAGSIRRAISFSNKSKVKLKQKENKTSLSITKKILAKSISDGGTLRRQDSIDQHSETASNYTLPAHTSDSKTIVSNQTYNTHNTNTQSNTHSYTTNSSTSKSATKTEDPTSTSLEKEEIENISKSQKSKSLESDTSQENNTETYGQSNLDFDYVSESLVGTNTNFEEESEEEFDTPSNVLANEKYKLKRGSIVSQKKLRYIRLNYIKQKTEV